MSDTYDIDAQNLARTLLRHCLSRPPAANLLATGHMVPTIQRLKAHGSSDEELIAVLDTAIQMITANGNDGPHRIKATPRGMAPTAPNVLNVTLYPEGEDATAPLPQGARLFVVKKTHPFGIREVLPYDKAPPEPVPPLFAKELGS